MKKVVSLFLCIVMLTLCGCEAGNNTPKLKETYSQTARITVGDYSYNANVRFDNGCVYITPTSTNARGMTISCDGKTVTFTRRDMLKRVDKNNVSEYNPAVLLYDALTVASTSNSALWSKDICTFTGKTPVGDFSLTANQTADLLQFSIPTAHFSICFDE